jgi:hypothetical protein
VATLKQRTTPYASREICKGSALHEWLTDAKEVCALCGVRIAFFGGKLFDFDVNNKFMIVWHRRVPDAAVPQDPPRR